MQFICSNCSDFLMLLKLLVWFMEFFELSSLLNCKTFKTKHFFKIVLQTTIIKLKKNI